MIDSPLQKALLSKMRMFLLSSSVALCCRARAYRPSFQMIFPVDLSMIITIDTDLRDVRMCFLLRMGIIELMRG